MTTKRQSFSGRRFANPPGRQTPDSAHRLAAATNVEWPERRSRRMSAHVPDEELPAPLHMNGSITAAMIGTLR